MINFFSDFLRASASFDITAGSIISIPLTIAIMEAPILNKLNISDNIFIKLFPSNSLQFIELETMFGVCNSSAYKQIGSNNKNINSIRKMFYGWSYHKLFITKEFDLKYKRYKKTSTK